MKQTQVFQICAELVFQMALELNCLGQIYVEEE